MKNKLVSLFALLIVIMFGCETHTTEEKVINHTPQTSMADLQGYNTQCPNGAAQTTFKLRCTKWKRKTFMGCKNNWTYCARGNREENLLSDVKEFSKTHKVLKISNRYNPSDGSLKYVEMIFCK